ncbi:hypothetical protein BHF71_09185 [Vulcanibacillus modesticaldus]|uniref:SAM-dependent methyltransferase n=1 Tax=Vulcanibacillus modesticaldus TaxID=337097 RepID=A0A1D2YUC8_9BACI|nr:SAM-dependent methyltransferase [Vulcanibacillus modesticaldus]OEF99286.1 hypothetical protein BHF71_09185 [Vulcanibacillus modesticaldus]
MVNSQLTKLAKEIIGIIQEQPQKRIRFYDFMKMALYEKELGYYTKDRTKIGKEADFYTSSSVGPVFGYTIANNFVELLPYTTNDNKFSILEIGGGNGRFARDVLDGLRDEHQKIYNNLTYYMLETSPYHEKIQKAMLGDHLDRVKWINDLEILSGFNGLIFSNELVDAFPVYKVRQQNGELKEVYVTWDEKESEFKEIIDEISDHRLKKYFDDMGITLKEGQTTEVNLDAVDWIKSVGKILNRGYVLTIDYGYPAEELYASHRHEGTLMCYYKHTANDNPYQNIGDQDITTHVNFTALINYGSEVGLETIWFTHQSNFLLNNGILNYLREVGISNGRDIFNDEDLKLNRAIRQLITPGEMGETFKVLLQQKNVGNHQYRFLMDIWKQYGL